MFIKRIIAKQNKFAIYYCIGMLCLFLSHASFGQTHKEDSIRFRGIKHFDDFIRGRFNKLLKTKNLSEPQSLGITFLNTENKSKTLSITTNHFSDTIEMGGTLDRLNTEEFQPMQIITIANKGKKTIQAPRLGFNNRGNWYDLPSLASEATKNADENKNKLLNIWQFIVNNRIHEWPAGYDDYVFYKALTIYGYGTCDIAANNVIGIAKHLGYTNHCNVKMPHHEVAQIYFNEKEILLDSDLKVFYLGFDNQTLIGYENIEQDRYLVSRTAHKYYPYYNKNFDDQVAKIYSNVVLDKKEERFKYNYDFLLRPNESINFRWDIAKYAFHNWVEIQELAPEIISNTISNSKYILSTDFLNTTFAETFERIDGIEVQQQDTLPKIFTRNPSACFYYPVRFSYPLLDAWIYADFRSTSNVQDSVEIFISVDDENTWVKVWGANILESLSDSIYIGQFLQQPIPGSSQNPSYSYTLKFVLCSSDSSSYVGLDSLYIENTFQISKFFLPSLQLGENIISYSDQSNERDVEITINWQESSDNTPPNKVENPVFPTNEAITDSLYFAFEWQPATDDDGDEIADYEFFLADHPEMNYLLSPNFNQYVSAFGEETIRPYFKVKETGWLNHGQTYYWKVRAKDSKGTWGQWSDIWSFTPQGVMRPLNVRIDSISSQIVTISWSQNQSGTQPDFYKIYASDESNGFTPNESNLLTTATDTTITILYTGDSVPKTFYRIAACQNNGQESLISEAVSLSFPHFFLTSDTIFQSGQFSLKMGLNKKYYPFYYYGNDTTFYNPEIVIIKKPDWLVWNGTEFLGMSNDTIWGKLLYDTSYSNIVVDIMLDGDIVETKNITLNTTYQNSCPELFVDIDTVAIESYLFETYIAILDKDIPYSDKYILEVKNLPKWMTYKLINNTIYLKGTPLESDIDKDNYISILVKDSYGCTIDTTITITVLPNSPKLATGSLVAKENELFKTYVTIATEDKAYSHNFQLSAETVPNWLQATLLNDTIWFSGTPCRPNHIGLNKLVVGVTNELGTIQKRSYTIKVDYINHVPKIVSIPQKSIKVGEEYNYTLIVEDEDILVGDTLAYQIQGLPLGLTFFNAAISGIPAMQGVGTHRIIITAKDKKGALALQGFYLRVIPFEEEQTPQNSIAVPNPFTNWVMLVVQSEEDAEAFLTIYNIKGQLVYQEKVYLSQGTDYLYWNTSNVSVGIYYANLQIKDKKLKYKLIKK